jgi:hypothetical protein
MSFSSFVLTPSGNVNVSGLQFTVKFNCDDAGSIRTNYDEQVNDIRFVVNGTTVYSCTGGGKYWNQGTGSGTKGRSAYPAAPTTPYHSYVIWYALSSADVLATEVAENVPFDVSVDIKGSYAGDWVTVATSTVTLTHSWQFYFYIYDSDWNTVAEWAEEDAPPTKVKAADIAHLVWECWDTDSEYPYTLDLASYEETGWAKTSPADTVQSYTGSTIASAEYDFDDPPENGTWYFRGKFTEDTTGIVREYETTVGVGGLPGKPKNPAPGNTTTGNRLNTSLLQWQSGD